MSLNQNENHPATAIMPTPSRLLGLVLAGGRSSRFGTDKALALLDGRTLLDHAVARLSPWCGQVVIAGRKTGPAPCLPDWPRPDLGPLGGLAAALKHAGQAGFEYVLSCGVDSPGLPDDLPALLMPGPSCVAEQPVIGLWPASTLPVIEAILTGDGSHAVRHFAAEIKARPVELATPLANINRPQDLARLHHAGLGAQNG